MWRSHDWWHNLFIVCYTLIKAHLRSVYLARKGHTLVLDEVDFSGFLVLKSGARDWKPKFGIIGRVGKYEPIISTICSLLLLKGLGTRLYFLVLGAAQREVPWNPRNLPLQSIHPALSTKWQQCAGSNRPLRIKYLFELTRPAVNLRHPIAEFTIDIYTDSDF